MYVRWVNSISIFLRQTFNYVVILDWKMRRFFSWVSEIPVGNVVLTYLFCKLVVFWKGFFIKYILLCYVLVRVPTVDVHVY